MKGDKKVGSRFVGAPPVRAAELSERIGDVPERDRMVRHEPRLEAEGMHHANRELEEPLADPQQVEAALVLSEEMFRAAFDRAPLGMALNSPDGRRLKVNRAFCQMLGYSEKVLLGLNPASIIHPDDQDALRLGIHRLVTGEIDRDFKEWRYIHADGHIVFADVSASAVRDAQRVLQYIVVQLEDVTERNRAREALREAEQKYRDIFENASEGIFQSTPDGQYIAANPALAQIHGFESPEELIRRRKDISRQVYIDPKGREEFKQLIEAQGFVRGFEHRIFRRDGSKIWVSINARVVRNQHGKILYYEGTAQDINERKVAEARSAAFATLARKLSGATTKLEAARIIVETARELFGWDSCNLDLYDVDRDLVLPMLKVDTVEGRQVEVADLVSSREPTARTRRVIDQGPLLILREEPIQFDKDAVAFGDKLKPSAAIMSVPILHASTVVGILSIQSYRRRAYNAQALNDLQSLADHCGAAINRINAEESFYESEERFRQLAHQFEDVVWLTDQDVSKVLYVNPAYEKTFRRTCESAYERLTSFLDTIHPEDRAAVERMLERQRQGNHQPLEYRIVWPDGSVRWIHRRSLPIRNTEGEVYMVAGIAQDITERKRAEEALKNSEQDFRHLFEQAHDAILVFDPEHEIVLDVNERACEVYGFTRAEFIGMSLETISRNVVRGKHEIHQTLERGDYPNFETVQRRKDGTEMFLEINASTIVYQGRLVILSINRDVTERKRAEESLRKQNEYLAALHETALGLINRLDLNELLADIVTRALALVDIPSGYIYLVEPGGEQMRLAVGVGVSLNFVGALICKGEGVAGTIWETGQPLVVDDYRNWEHRLKDPGYDVLRAVGAVPLRSGSRVVGVLGVESTKDGQGLNEHQIDILNRFAQLASIALDNAQLHSAVRESEERYRDLVENSRELICTHDLDGVILSANRAAVEVLGYDPREFEGRKMLRDLLAPEVSDQFDDYLARIRSDGVASGTMLVQTRTGEHRLLEYHNTLRTEGVPAPIVRGMANDITERKRAQVALLESEKKYRDLVETAHDLIWAVDAEGRITFMNQASRNIYGYEPDELIGRSYFDLLSPEERTRQLDIFPQMMASGQKIVVDSECEVMDREGNRHMLLANAVIRFDQQGNAIGSMGTSTDITERKRAEESLNLFRNLIEQSTDAIEVMDPVTLRFVDCNESAHRSLGYTREEFLALTVFDIDPTLNRATLARLNAEMEESGLATIESVHRRKDGTTFPVEVNVKRVSLEKVYRLASVRDITGRRLAEVALRESEERYRELFENAKDAIYVHDLSGRYVSVNRAAETLSGYSREEILGKHYSNFVAPRNLKHARTNLCKKLDEADETIYEVFMITKDKRAVPVEVSSRLIHENGVPVGVQGIVRDITERKRAQDALQNYSRRLIEAQESERQHIARELHDEIGQVLTAVKINLQSIQRLGPDSDWTPPLFESIGIVDEALGRVRELSIELRPSLLDDLGLSAALRWYVDRYAQRTGIRAEVMNGFEEEGRLPRELETACFRIAQEALTNVVRHARANSVSVKLERLRERLVLTISDDGIGFDVEGLFSNASTMAALGLRGMEERALAVRGKIEIESALQNGTRVRAIFPFKRRK